MKIEGVLGNQFGFRKGKGPGMQLGFWNNIRSKFGHRRGTVCMFMDWQKAFDCVNWTKLIRS
jgi:hypothetical protein